MRFVMLRTPVVSGYVRGVTKNKKNGGNGAAMYVRTWCRWQMIGSRHVFYSMQKKITRTVSSKPPTHHF